MRFKTPIVYLCFNRPDFCESTLARIAEINPERVYVISDGPRAHVPEDSERVARVRECVEQKLSGTKVIKRYQEENLGCRRNVSSGISWVFEQVDRAIILEDDCLPDLSFFPFCEELLERYANNDSVSQISGSNLLSGDPILFSKIESDYFFSRFPFIWGWATWARAWRHYDVSMKEWAALSTWKKNLWGPLWSQSFEGVASGLIDTWDYQWAYTVFSRQSKNITSVKNLVTNIGFRDDATHTKVDAFNLGNKALEAQSFPLKHRRSVELLEGFDTQIATTLYGPNSIESLRAPYRSFLKRQLLKLRKSL